MLMSLALVTPGALVELAPVAWVWENQLQPSTVQKEFLPVADSSNRESWLCMQESWSYPSPGLQESCLCLA